MITNNCTAAVLTESIVIKPENRMLNAGEKAGFSGKKREISGI